ncbi:MAG: hypothetical protein KGQ46_05695 [Hyphomicrobiales bacterium]|nr:hypothetical protein [Hyphomicrobiales bacterium]MDE2116095.1 hypothetical protein [Hyphomicrobiales bacterium]
MANDLIRYDLRVQEALRAVIYKVLADSARDGLPGDHYFQITFRTDAEGVRLSTDMRHRFPEEMTIILQHQFRELTVTETALEVVLFFNHVPERLLIPFTAISGFFDPSVQFGLRFDVQEPAEAEAGTAESPADEPAQPAVSVHPLSAAERLATNIAKRGTHAENSEAADAAQERATDAKDDGKIVSIDAFRRKP